MVLESEIKLVELNNFYENLENPIAAELFNGVLQMRKSGYQDFYHERFLPFDRSDLIATHYLICKKEGGKLIPFGGYKKVSLELCDYYQVKLPILDWLGEKITKRHLSAIEKLITKHRQNNYQLTYAGHLVLYNKPRKLISSQFLREFVAANSYRCWLSGAYTEIVTSILRTKTHQWFEQIGFSPFGGKDISFSPAQHPQSPEDLFIIMEMRQPSEWSKRCYEKYKTLFDDRLCIKSEKLK